MGSDGRKASWERTEDQANVMEKYWQKFVLSHKKQGGLQTEPLIWDSLRSGD